MRFLAVKNFERFQHYKDRGVFSWIKLHKSLLSDYDFQALPDKSKAHLMLIWLLVSQRNDRRIPDDPRWVAQKIGATDKIDLQNLVDSGWLIPLEVAYQEQKEPKSTPSYIVSSDLISSSLSGSDPDQFDEFYAQYPRHVAKESARKAWHKLTPSERSLALLDVSRRKAGEWSNKEPQYVPHPATYLNGRRWTDETAPATRAGLRLSEGRKGLWDNIERLERANGTNGSTQNPVESVGHLEPPIDRRSGAG